MKSPFVREITLWLGGKESTCNCREDPLEKEMATHSSILAWEIPWTEGPGGPQSMGITKKLSNNFTAILGRGYGPYL